MAEEEDWKRMRDGGRGGLEEDEGCRKRRIGRGRRMEEEEDLEEDEVWRKKRTGTG